MGQVFRSIMDRFDPKSDKAFEREEKARAQEFVRSCKPLFRTFKKQFPFVDWVLDGETKSLRGTLASDQENGWTCTIYVKPSERKIDLVSMHSMPNGEESELCHSGFVYRNDPVVSLKNFFVFQQELARPFTSSP